MRLFGQTFTASIIERIRAAVAQGLRSRAAFCRGRCASGWMGAMRAGGRGR
jgi:hypothetical protein